MYSKFIHIHDGKFDLVRISCISFIPNFFLATFFGYIVSAGPENVFL